MVSRRQALRAGVSRNTFVSKVNHGLWQQLHPGMCGAFTGALSREVRLWAAVLYAGPGALLSHETAFEVPGLAGYLGCIRPCSATCRALVAA